MNCLTLLISALISKGRPLNFLITIQKVLFWYTDNLEIKKCRSVLCLVFFIWTSVLFFYWFIFWTTNINIGSKYWDWRGNTFSFLEIISAWISVSNTGDNSYGFLWSWKMLVLYEVFPQKVNGSRHDIL